MVNIIASGNEFRIILPKIFRHIWISVDVLFRRHASISLGQIPSLPRRLGHLNFVPYVLPLQHKIDSLVGTLDSPNRTRRVALDDISDDLRRDLDSLNVISWSTANRPCRKARETCQKDVLHLARSIFLPLRNLLDAAKKGRRATGAFPGDTFLGGAGLGEHFSGVFRGHEKGRPAGRPVRCGCGRD